MHHEWSLVMKRIASRFLIAFVCLGLTVCFSNVAFAQKFRYAEAGPLDVKKIINLVVFERAKARGVDYEVVYFKTDDVASQAIIGNQVDVVISSLAYSAISELKAPYRHILQLRPLIFFPVAAKSFATSWADMNGKDFVVHARGSGTEMMAREIETANGIKLGRLSYVPGSQVRANALLKGNMKATMLDIQGMQYVLRRSPDEFVVLPLPDLPVSEAALYARTDFLEKNREKIEILIEEFITVIRAAAKDPAFISAERKRLNLWPDLAPDLAAEINPFHETAAKLGLFPLNGGGEAAAKADLDFYSKSGVVKGEASTLQVSDYWDFSFLNAVLDRVGRVSTSEAN